MAADCWALPPSADLIFVFAGRDYRKHYGLELYRRGLANTIMLSVGRFEIRSFSSLPLPVPTNLLKYASDIPPHRRHFLVWINAEGSHVQHVLPRRLGTLTEVEALKSWLLDRPEVQAIVLVSSRSHLRRVRICCQSLLASRSQLHFVSPAAELAEPQENNKLLSTVLELVKTAGYWLLLTLHLEAATMKLRSRDRA
jgi:hypothetical protein